MCIWYFRGLAPTKTPCSRLGFAVGTYPIIIPSQLEEMLGNWDASFGLLLSCKMFQAIAKDKKDSIPRYERDLFCAYQ